VTKGEADLEYLVARLNGSGKKEMAELAKEADSVRKENVGEKIFFRGIIEFSNVCEKDCFYCGIRRSNKGVKRFTMGEREIKECARWAYDNHYGSIVLQSGERTDKAAVDFLVKLVRDIKKETARGSAKGLGVTLCVGELGRKDYEELFEAGAHRYLLRIETANPLLYAKIHPSNASFANRLRCLKDMKDIGYQVGTGAMIGLPGQTIEDIAKDILFYKEFGADMIGMGPYIVHKETPLAARQSLWHGKRGELFELALRVVALTRIMLKDVNIAATTAMQALHPRGRELAFQYGANIIMPIITPTVFRKDYFLYDGKPCIDENAAQCKACIAARIKSIGRQAGWGEYGDSPHYFKRQNGGNAHE